MKGGVARVQASSSWRLEESSRCAADLAEEQLGLLLDAGDHIRSGDETLWRGLDGGDGDQGCAELGRVSALPAVHALPRSDGLSGPLGVVVDGQFGPNRGLALHEEFGAEEAGFDDSGVDAVGPDAVLEGFHPAFQGDLDLNYLGLDLASDRTLQMLVFSAEPGSASHDGLRLLADWAATHSTGLEST